jgi:hypothetical protein
VNTACPIRAVMCASRRAGERIAFDPAAHAAWLARVERGTVAGSRGTVAASRGTVAASRETVAASRETVAASRSRTGHAPVHGAPL